MKGWKAESLARAEQQREETTAYIVFLENPAVEFTIDRRDVKADQIASARQRHKRLDEWIEQPRKPD